MEKVRNTNMGGYEIEYIYNGPEYNYVDEPDTVFKVGDLVKSTKYGKVLIIEEIMEQFEETEESAEWLAAQKVPITKEQLKEKWYFVGFEDSDDCFATYHSDLTAFEPEYDVVCSFCDYKGYGDGETCPCCSNQMCGPCIDKWVDECKGDLYGKCGQETICPDCWYRKT